MKFILILILAIYAIYRLSVFMGRFSSSQSAPSGKDHVHVDRNPNAGKKSYQGGEYVDYEEVK